jgi:signal transduction histidine kinase
MAHSRTTAHPADRGRRRRFRGRARTIRLKLTLTYGVVFLITGAVLLTIGYILVRHNLDAQLNLREGLERLGLPPSALPLRRHPPAEQQLINLVRHELRSQALHQLVVDYLIALVVMTIISVGAGWLLAGRALRPLRDITAAARRVSGENLGERIGLVGPADELKELADTFDRMLGRLDSAFNSQRHFVANASHELRTPLAIMRTEVDVALADDRASVDELRQMGEAVREMIDRCERLIEALLMLARSEALTGREERVNLAPLAADCITDLRARAEDSRIAVKLELQPAWVRGEPRLLERMIANLIDNGIRHNEIDGFLQVRTFAIGGRDGVCGITVRNGGAPISAADAAQLMEPFRRIDRAVAGFGLGLSIVRSVAAAHGGSAEVTAPPTGGLEVTVRLPAARAETASVALAADAETVSASAQKTFTKTR